MRTDPEEAIERLLALLDLQGKVRLVTGANFWTTQADQTIGLRSMVLSDGPVGVRGPDLGGAAGAGGVGDRRCRPRRTCRHEGQVDQP
jgi:hypothetical protein